MHVVEQILSNIANGEHIAPQMRHNQPLVKLVEAYNQFALHSSGGENLYSATGETYGLDLKRYVNFLPAHEQLKLLNEYLHNCEMHDIPLTVVEEIPSEEEAEPERPTPTPRHLSIVQNRRESDSVKEERRLRHFLIKWAAITASVLALLVTGAILSMMYHNHTAPDNALIKTVIETATAIFKVLFPPTK